MTPISVSATAGRHLSTSRPQCAILCHTPATHEQRGSGEGKAATVSADQNDNQRPQPTFADGEPLPPLPDGGLARVMPDWLREAEPGASPRPAADPNSDPAEFITADDLPAWLRLLPPESPPVAPPPVSISAGPRDTIPAPPPLLPAARPASDPAPAAPAPIQTTDPTAPAATAPAATPPRLTTPAMTPHPTPSRDRRALVAIAGFAILALAVLAYLVARGLL